LLEGDLLELLAAAASGELGGVAIEASAASAVTVVLAAEGYPTASDRGSPVSGVDEAEAGGALVFHSGTALHGDRLVTNGGRIVSVTGVAETLAAARDAAYVAASRIEFAGMRYRTDIAEAAAAGRA
jgi:phosphoribosylamine--glycine ligase